MSTSDASKGTGTVASPAMDGGQEHRIADIYQRFGNDHDDQLIELSWSADRTPDPMVLPEPLPGELGEAWPTRPEPRKTLRPRAGHSAPTVSANAPTLFVCVFGLTPDKVAAVVNTIDRQYRMARNFRPLFLTDSSDSRFIRHAGFSHEFFPPAIYGSEDDALRFEQRFHWLWQKWKGDNLIDFSAPGYLTQRLEDLDQFIKEEDLREKRFNPRKKKPAPARKPTTDVIALKAAYVSAGLDQEPDTFVLYRILGNDLPPRHEIGQTLTNLRFLLDNEPDLPGCEKRWVVNRIVDPEQEAAIIAFLEERDQPYLHIPFILDEYAEAEWDITSFPGDAFFLRGHYHEMNEYDQLRAEAHVRRFKNNYLIHNNGARNAALRDGRDRAKWVLPWDGNCFLTESAWAEIVQGVTSKPYLKYFTVPMSRTINNDDLLLPDYRPEADEEPQILFRCDTDEEFNESFYYGRRPKVELFYRLGIPGKWDDWPDDVWDLPRAPRSPDAGTCGDVGWVARLFSGQKMLEADKTSGLRNRGEARIAAITAMLDRHDVAALGLTYSPETLTAYDEHAVTALRHADSGTPDARLKERLVLEADLALQRGPYSVVEKTMLPPSGDKNDYYHPAPYWWPNPATPSGMPFLFRDGERIPGTRLYEPESARYDRTRLQRMFDDTTFLALGWLLTGAQSYIDHAAQNIRTWFLDEDTRMNPHLLYSQVRSQTINDVGAKSGLIEMKDLYYLLDAVRLIERAGCLSDTEKTTLRAWLREYLEWLQTSEQGIQERLTNNNHGTCFDLQTGSIAAFLGDRELLERTFFISRERILEQFTSEGRQPHEMKRTQTAHYCCFNLQCWINLATLAEACGHDLWSFEGKDGRGLAKAFSWLLPHLARPTWKYEQIEPFDRGRFLPLFYTARARASGPGSLHMTEPGHARPVFFAHDGIKPFWMLTRGAASVPVTPSWKALSEQLAKLEHPVSELCKGTAFVRDGASDARELDKKLWGGFSEPAVEALEALRDGEEIDPKERTRAARTLARWTFTRGDLDATLLNSDAMMSLGVTGERERALLRAYCLDRQGDPSAAAACLEEPLSLFLNDANLFLAMANIVHAQSNGGASASWSEWINKIYKLNKLPDFVGEDWQPALRGSAAPQVDAGNVQVTVVLLVEHAELEWVRALSSLQNQTMHELSIIVVDATGDRKTTDALKVVEQMDARVSIHQMRATERVSALRNAALEMVRTPFVVFQSASDCMHPSKIAQQFLAFTSEEIKCAVSQRILMTEAGHIRAEWAPDFRLFNDHAAGAMYDTDTLRALGGWDAVDGDPEPFLLWRMKKSLGTEAFAAACPGVPLSMVFDDTDIGQPTHLDFPYGHKRNAFRAFLRRVKRDDIEAGAQTGEEPLMIRPFEDTSTEITTPLTTVYVGDFSSGAAAIDQLRNILTAASAEGEHVGVFHWPDYQSTWKDELDDEIALLIDHGLVTQVSAFEPVKVDTVVLANPFVVYNQVDGLPDFAPNRLVVLFGQEFHIAEFDDGLRKHLPLRSELETHFGMPIEWRAL